MLVPAVLAELTSAKLEESTYLLLPSRLARLARSWGRGTTTGLQLVSVAAFLPTGASAFLESETEALGALFSFAFLALGAVAGAVFGTFTFAAAAFAL